MCASSISEDLLRAGGGDVQQSPGGVRVELLLVPTQSPHVHDPLHLVLPRRQRAQQRGQRRDQKNESRGITRDCIQALRQRTQKGTAVILSPDIRKPSINPRGRLHRPLICGESTLSTRQASSWSVPLSENFGQSKQPESASAASLRYRRCH